MLSNLLEFAVMLGLMTVLAVLMGKWLTRVFTGPGHALLERGTYRLLGIDPRETMGWARYASALLLANAAMMLLGYLVLRLQGSMPLNPLELAAQTPDLAFNTAASIITNTNWQAYSGETSLSNCISETSEQRPELGRISNFTEKTSLNNNPRKNTGVA